MPFAVCRIQKIKSWGLLAGKEAHTSRTRDTPNANPQVTNVRLIGSPDDANLATLVKNKIGSQKIRSNAVLAVEMLLSSSAEYFRPHAPNKAGVYDKRCLDNFVQATIHWLSCFWGDRIIRAELHLDEITPHIHAYLVPLDERGKLNCRALFGTRDKLYSLQDSFAEAVAHLGISRGIKGSTATYTKIKKYYAAVNQDSLFLDWERCLPQPQAEETSESYRQRVIEVLSPQLETINYQLQERSRIQRHNSQLKQTASKSEQLRRQLESELQLLRLTTSNWHDLSLELVGYELGLNQYQQVNNSSNSQLDLVMEINNCTFDDAVAWLRDRFGETAMLTAVTHHAQQQAIEIAQRTPPSIFIPPTSSHRHWTEVENYLTATYSIPRNLIQTLHQRNLVYADLAGNAVFLARSLTQEITGAYLYSPFEASDRYSLYPGSRRSCGWFHVSMGGNSNVPIITAVLVSSPMDALSLMVLNSPHHHRTLYLAVDDSDRLAAVQAHYYLLPVEFLQTVPNILIAMPKETKVAIQKILPSATQMEPNNSCKKQLQQCYVKEKYVELE
ncbi:MULTISPECIES: MobV family relaxase [unclassified Tolypothrix]|uniref:MobV family relaxase n=1 Tax=unclassified Tolypothrix TaxID=2649714 RepID=UPI0005EAC15E|nr:MULTISPECIES: MobV family relaxase [unclassified Tolypothrix]BAY93656.1 plasmid recombination enzyme [Microchaete diplosiphon NIES-3275]EKE99543.1 putative plasmid recombination protein [Tolypothrix sp. PCC 7601]MBE9081709.1 plasmid recombination protein [Tolypothrix sp. LEGE 11397]UYD27476.1 plasmid recombination protein [Tolypothrix sp. PCC 7712]UYD36660.1 plasmid recombination protein [Tolypothrix sp. PCC 7601]